MPYKRKFNLDSSGTLINDCSLSYLFQVEELMREQLSTDPDNTSQSLCHSRESLTSTCSTATETPERQIDEDTTLLDRSPSEGYTSAYGSSYLGDLADTEYYSATSRGSSDSDLSEDCNDYGTSHRGSGHCPPSLQDFNATLIAGSNYTSSSSSLLSESMFSSTYSPKYEALEDKVRKLCQSTSDLDEKMRLARLECGYDMETLS